MKRLTLSLLIGIAMTGTLTFFEYQYCMDGPGRGWPFAVIYPAHLNLVPGETPPTRGDEPFSILLRSDISYPPQVSGLAVVGDIIVWGAVAFFLWQLYIKGRSRTRPSVERPKDSHNAV